MAIAMHRTASGVTSTVPLTCQSSSRHSAKCLAPSAPRSSSLPTREIARLSARIALRTQCVTAVKAPKLRTFRQRRTKVRAGPSTEIPPPLTDEDEEDPPVVCARGVCVADENAWMVGLPDEVCYVEETADGELVETCVPNPDKAEGAGGLSVEFLWPRALLLFCSVLYGTNFALGALMNDSLPASAATSARMVLAAGALSPFLLQLDPAIRNQAMVCGLFTSLGYITQSLALVDTPASTVCFLGALTVLVCPTLEAAINGRQLSLRDAPQVWLAAMLAVVSVGFLELADGFGDLGAGDVYAVLQAVGFGTSFFITERMMAKSPSQALPITAVQVAMCALTCSAWAAGDHAWFRPDSDMFALPQVLFDVVAPAGEGATGASARTVGIAVLWTGLITTAANRLGETTALGKLSSAEASVLLATEPLWACVFAYFFIGEAITGNDVIGGVFMVGACLANSIDPETLTKLIPDQLLGPETPQAKTD